MKKILVESRKKSAHCQPPLDAIASSCRELGYRVIRWRGPLSRKYPYRDWIPRCDLAIVFNGSHRKYGGVVAKLHRRQTPILFVELGWHPQLDTFQLDHQGINAAASWVQQPLAVVGETSLLVRPKGDLLLILQDDGDTQITDSSPSFPDMHSFVEHVLRHSLLPVRVRAHPRHPPDERIAALLDQHGATWDDSADLSDALRKCRALACVNSSSAMEALTHRIPVLCYGKAIFRQPGAVYCLGSDRAATRAATAELGEGRSSLFVECLDAVVERVRANQWWADQLPDRLAHVIDAAWQRTDPSGSRRKVRRPPCPALPNGIAR